MTRSMKEQHSLTPGNRGRRFGTLALLFATMATSASAAGPTRYIHDNWRLARIPDVTADGASISQAGYDDDAWVPAIVPGTVLTSYERAGLIENPYYSNNMQNLSQDYYNVDYWYRTEFQVPADYAGRRIWLNFDGIHWKADIYLNGSKLADLDGAFIRGQYDVTERVNIGGSNAVAVRLEWCNAEPWDAPTFIGSQGWDWMPPIPGRNLGLYEDVYLSTSGDVTITDPQVVTDLPLPDLSSADVSVTVDLTNHAATAVSGTLTGTIEPRGITFSQAVTLNAGQTKTVAFNSGSNPQLRIQNPQLWWPNGYGDQTLHTLTLNFQVGTATSDTEAVTFGIREYSYDMDGHELYLSVNGHRVLCKGGNWGMPEAMLKWKDKDFETALRLHKEMNFTMIRTWHGNSDFKAFYDACDRYGLMVFEDFWMNGWIGPNEPDMFMAAARDKIRRLRNHPCVAVWCAENEAIPTEPIRTQLPAALNELDDTRYYFEASNQGGIHGGVSYAIEDPAWYFGAASGFTTEIGSPCVPSVESMRAMMDVSDLWPITTRDSVWAWHDWDPDIGNKQPQRYFDQVNARYGTAAGIEDFCKKAQLINLETYKAIFEAWNHKLFDDCGGLLLWMSQSAWPSTIWQTYDYYFEGTGAYFGAKKACEPVHIQWSIEDGSVKVVNTTRQPLDNLSATAEVYNMDGTLMHRETRSGLNVPVNSAVHCFDILNTVGTNLALGKTAVASSIENDNHPAAYAVDGSVGTRWSSEYSDPQWIYVDLGSVQSIDSVVLRWESAYGKVYEIQVSDDAQAWTTVFSTTTGDGQADTISFSPVEARYVRMYGTARGTGWGYSLFEFIVNETGSMPTPIAGLSEVHFLKLVLSDASGGVLSDNVYWDGNTHLDYTALNSLEPVNLSCSARQTQQAGVSTLTANLTNNSDGVAMAIRLKLLRKTSGDRVLPAVYEDNYFTLMPGESRTVAIEYENALLQGDRPKLMVEGYNILAEEIGIQENTVPCDTPYPSFLDVAGPNTLTDDLAAFVPEPDCRVNLYDFVIFARGWLTSGLYPPL